MKNMVITKNIWIIWLVVGVTFIFGMLIWNQFFPSLQSSVIALPPEIITKIEGLQSQRDEFLKEKKMLANTLSDTRNNIESVEQNLTYNTEAIRAIEEEFQWINAEIVLNESHKDKELTAEEYQISLASLLQKKQDILVRKKQTQSLHDSVSKQRNALSERLAQSDLRIRQIDILVRGLDTDIARIIAQAD